MTKSTKQKLVHVSPAMAEAWLTKNLNNRPVSEAHVQVLAGRPTNRFLLCFRATTETKLQHY